MVNTRTYLKEIASISLKNGDPYCVDIENAQKQSMQVQRNENGELLKHEHVFDKKSVKYGNKPSAANKRLPTQKKSSALMKEEALPDPVFVKSRDNPDYYLMSKEHFNLSKNQMEAQTNVLQKLSSLSNIAKPVASIYPKETT